MELENHKLHFQEWMAKRSGTWRVELFDLYWGQAVQAVLELCQALWEEHSSGQVFLEPNRLKSFLMTTLTDHGLLLQMRQGSGPAGLRARVDLEARTVTVYQEAVLELARANQEVAHEQALLMLLSHEIWHVLRPNCSSDWSELAAHLWCAKLTGQTYLDPCVGIARTASRQYSPQKRSE